MRQIPKVVQIPTNTTEAQMENALSNLLNSGWELVAVFNLGTKTFAILVREVAR